jgi:hypothetical protein
MGILDKIRVWFQGVLPIALRLAQAFTAAFAVAAGIMIDIARGLGLLLAAIARVGEAFGKVSPGTAQKIEAGEQQVQQLQEKYMQPGANGEPSYPDRVLAWIGQQADKAEAHQNDTSTAQYVRGMAPWADPAVKAYQEGKARPGTYDAEAQKVAAHPGDTAAPAMPGASDEENPDAATDAGTADAAAGVKDQVQGSGDQVAGAVRDGVAIMGQIRDSQREYQRQQVGHKQYTGSGRQGRRCKRHWGRRWREWGCREWAGDAFTLLNALGHLISGSGWRWECEPASFLRCEISPHRNGSDSAVVSERAG